MNKSCVSDLLEGDFAFPCWQRMSCTDGHLQDPLRVWCTFNVITFLCSEPSVLSPRATSAYFLTLLQTSCASTLSSVMKTCRRSPSILWCATSMPRDSRLEHHSSHKGTKNTSNEWRIIYSSLINYLVFSGVIYKLRSFIGFYALNH